MQQLPTFVTALETCDVAIGDRTQKSKTVSMSGLRKVIGRTYFIISSPLIPGIKDAACGCKLWKTAVAKEIFTNVKLHRFAFDVESLARTLKRGYTVTSIPVDWTSVPGSKVRLIKDGIEMFCRLLQMHYWFSLKKET
jgi:dolichyl-phosphate beta-glucosyltransferase